MDNQAARQRACYADDVYWPEIEQAVRCGSGRRRQQIQRRFFRFLGGLFVALTALAWAGEPLPFSHKRHASLRMECVYCHSAAITGARAGFPAASKCLLCHRQIASDTAAAHRLAALDADTSIVPERPVYVLPDFVIFSHARHKAGKISCQSCHGNIWAGDVVKLQLNMRMKACVDCHKEYRAAVKCTVCHELSQ